MSIGIIGTAGRSSDWLWFTREKYDYIVESVDRGIEEACQRSGLKKEEICLFSGGAAFMDHLVVRLFLTGKYKKLILFLPAFYDMKKKRYIETQIGDQNTGKQSNHYHDLARMRTGYDSLDEIGQAFDKGAIIQYYSSFKERNTGLARFANQAKASVYAFTLSSGQEPEDGGTYDTWSKLQCDKYHTSLTIFDSIVEKRREMSQKNKETSI